MPRRVDGSSSRPTTRGTGWALTLHVRSHSPVPSLRLSLSATTGDRGGETPIPPPGRSICRVAGPYVGVSPPLSEQNGEVSAWPRRTREGMGGRQSCGLPGERARSSVTSLSAKNIEIMSSSSTRQAPTARGAGGIGAACAVRSHPELPSCSAHEISQPRRVGPRPLNVRVTGPRTWGGGSRQPFACIELLK